MIILIGNFIFYRKNMNKKFNFFAVIFLIFSFVSGILWSYFYINFIDREENIKRETLDIKSLQTNISNIAKESQKSVVSIVVKKDITLYRQDPYSFFRQKLWKIEQNIWGWTWFIISKNWYILTNKHVITDKNAKYIVINSSMKEFEAEVIAWGSLSDLAVLKINSNKEFIPLKLINNQENLNIWEFVIAIWNALSEFQNSVTFWILSWKNRTIEVEWINTSQKLTGLLQTDASINVGNSWWPLLNIFWEVVWINTAIATNGQWLGFSIPLTQSRVNYILSSIEKYGIIKKPFIGISYIPLNTRLASELWINSIYWAYIQNENNIVDGSPAFKKISAWDTILEINNQRITQTNTIWDIIQNNIPWDEISLKILKKSWEIKNIYIKLWEEK